ncbi:1-deoxy-D-xylulose-5-phosphate reductoisomerase [Thiorhodococcus mannitoliphagus]|uniref:1-deoxy-D-xylulose 5-phosphate reductoisomerase n=1 Tax=Thiorhodococcus mannitoliphagus TaxID=329406 RepID=A0A6P1DQ07_9GAMM|nr:1-deoxy-D-xylulose-5-phosphate reductoisomerase [Thiorhodococcus mannitoliphagus]NEX20357.1 1-deoxy-D-xylulose-5-phosphate reductoisomerase [Thiorhodococcus mannitoliphagus]
MIGVTVLGATGSIGVSTLDVLARHPDRFRAVALTANRDAERLAEQCRQHRPDFAVMADADAAVRLGELLADMPGRPEVLAGVEGLEQVAALPESHYVMAAIVGAAGLRPTLAAARAGKRVLLANKESLVVAGAMLMEAVSDSGAELLPIDSEHNAIFQCLPPNFADGLSKVGVKRILLTASGGPLKDWPVERLSSVTPEQACAHPTWAMGRKISVDSATMMNKGLEVIEACWLFGTNTDHIQVVVHPQSMIHSLVQYDDGSVLAQLGNPDMRTPITHALAWPDRIDSGVAPLDLFAVARLDFEEPDLMRFPCLGLAFEAARLGGTAPAVLNAANEVAVEAFLNRRVDLPGIAAVVADTLDKLPNESVENQGLEFLLEVDRRAREAAEQSVLARVN